MGRQELAALAKIIEEQLAFGTDSPLVGTWSIRFDRDNARFYFEKCEFGDYCEERPTVVGLDGAVIDKGGPILIEDGPR
jgi:hypothetical protein